MLCMRQAMTGVTSLLLLNDARGTRSRRPRTPLNPLYADGFRRVNLGRQRRHELRMDVLIMNRPTSLTLTDAVVDVKQKPAGDWAHPANVDAYARMKRLCVL